MLGCAFEVPNKQELESSHQVLSENSSSVRKVLGPKILDDAYDSNEGTVFVRDLYSSSESARNNCSHKPSKSSTAQSTSATCLVTLQLGAAAGTPLCFARVVWSWELLPAKARSADHRKTSLSSSLRRLARPGTVEARSAPR